MAVIKHIKIKNSNYDASADYLCFEHDEYTSKPILNADGTMIPREYYLLEGINCDPHNFARECEATNAYYNKNQTRNEIKAHHYILSFDPRDKDENGLTPEHAQELGLKFAKNNFPGHQTLVCTHPDGHNSAGNIHVHIVINSVRKLTVPQEPFMERPGDCKAGNKHRSTTKFLNHLKQETMSLCQNENYYQVDLLSPAKIRITDKEYWAQRRGQIQLDKENNKQTNTGIEPNVTTFETQKGYLRRVIVSVLDDSLSYEEFQKKLFEQYGISVHESREKIAYIIPDREKPIRGRQLGTNFEKEYIINSLALKFLTHKTHTKLKPNVLDNTNLVDSIRQMIDIESNPKAKLSKAYAQKVKLGNLQQMSKTLAFLQENHIENVDDIKNLLSSTHSDFLSKQAAMKETETQLKRVNFMIRYSGQYLANKKTYNDYLQSKNKQKFRAEHSSEITLYETARKELKRLSDNKKIPTLKQLRVQKEKLTFTKNKQYEDYSFSRSKFREIQTIHANITTMLDKTTDINIQQKHEQNKSTDLDK